MVLNMTHDLIHRFVDGMAEARPAAIAIRHRQAGMSYADLSTALHRFAGALAGLGVARSDRVAVYLEKRPETVISMFGATAAGAAFVPVNPFLRAHQVRHILKDCNVRVLVTSGNRLAGLAEVLPDCPDLKVVIQVDACADTEMADGLSVVDWPAAMNGAAAAPGPRGTIDVDMAAILYTSGSTGSPKGVVLSHHNLAAGAASVSSYLGNVPEDRILSVLPLSFDAGLSQLTTAFRVGAEVVLLNYLTPRDVVRACRDHRITGLTGVPPLWIQLAQLDWPDTAAGSMRYFANTGGRMPRTTLDRLRSLMPRAKPFLMYGLTEAFRSTYLDPAEVDRRPDSIGKAIPNAEILVVGADGRLCGPGEEGELVHRGALVSLGYWKDPERTAARFRPAPRSEPSLCLPEIAVWSGDIVRTDAEGFLYFVGRNDDMIKTSGYRVSPTEVEEIVYASGLVREAAALGLAHPELGQAICVVAVPAGTGPVDIEGLLEHCRRELPLYMVPSLIVERAALPRTPNGKLDRKQMALELNDPFMRAAE